jgi:hypothetical protein
LREPLRAELEALAHEKNISLNAEIVQRLQVSIADEKTGQAIFGDRNTYVLVSVIARTLDGLGDKMGKTWYNDKEIYTIAVETIYEYLNKVPFGFASDWAKPIIRTDAAAALKVVEAIIRRPLDEKSETEVQASQKIEEPDDAYFRWRENAKSNGLDRLFAAFASRRVGERYDEAVERVARKLFHFFNSTSPEGR